MKPYHQQQQYPQHTYQNNLDELIQNQGYMSERTKSPQRIQPPQPYENKYELYPAASSSNNQQQQYQNQITNKLNSARDMYFINLFYLGHQPTITKILIKIM